MFKNNPILPTMLLLNSCKINLNCVLLLKRILKFQGCACKFLYGPGTDEDKKEELEKVENQQTYHTVMVQSP